MKRPASSRKQPRNILVAVSILIGMLLLGALATTQAIRFQERLPEQKAVSIASAEYRVAFERANRALSTQARDALALKWSSEILTDVLTSDSPPDQWKTRLNRYTGVVRESQVGRLQQVAARLWLAEQADEPIENWWPATRTYLEGLEHANLSHHGRDLVTAWTTAYESLGFGPGTARNLAEREFAHPHGPFLQFIIPRLGQIAAERETAGDAPSAATARGVARRLLKTWVLEPGPPGLRLLAADLLSNEIEHAEKTLAANLRDWRAAYVERTRPLPVAFLDVRRNPARAPEQHARLARRVVLVSWLKWSLIVAAALAILSSWWWIREDNPASSRARRGLVCAILAAIVLCCGLAWVHAYPESVRADLRADFSSMYYWPAHPFLAGGLTLGLVLAAGVLQLRAAGGQSRLVARCGAIAAGTGLLLSVLLWGGALAGERARHDYEHATRAAAEELAVTPGGAESERLLDDLRRWEP